MYGGEQFSGCPLRIKFSSPPPTPEFLTRDFCLQPGLGWKFFTKENLVRQKKGSRCNLQDFHSLTKENQVSLLRIFLFEPGSDGKSTGLGMGVEEDLESKSGSQDMLPT